MGYKDLAEAVILQSLEDLWNPLFKEESKDFFSGEGFSICAEIAEMSSTNQNQLFHLFGGETNVKTGKFRSTA